MQIPAPSVMLDDGEVERRVRLIRPMERPAFSLAAMPQTHWREADRETFASAWAAEVAAVPEFIDGTIHIVAGLLLPIWKRLPNQFGACLSASDRCGRTHRRPQGLGDVGGGSAGRGRDQPLAR